VGRCRICDWVQWFYGASSWGINLQGCVQALGKESKRVSNVLTIFLMQVSPE
jgi:hypothetical protein